VGVGVGDLGIGDWGLGPIPNPQSPIPNPQSPIANFSKFLQCIQKIYFNFYNNKIITIKDSFIFQIF